MTRVLIVDDSPTEVHYLRSALERNGFETEAAATGQEGLEKAKQYKPDLILMDIIMPGLNGFQATRELGRDPATAGIPVIMVTTKSQETDRIWGLRQGAVDYVVKPVSEQDLVTQGARGAGTLSMTETSTLRRLRDQPFALLLEMERLARGAAQGGDGDEAEREWVGIAFRVERTVLLTPRDDVREVLRVPPVTRVPGARPWVRGLANVRGQLLPLTDLRAWLRGATAPAPRSARVLAVNHRRVPAGLIVDEVYGFRRFREGEQKAATATPFAGIEELVTGSFTRDGETWPVVSLKRLVESQRFLNAAE